MTFAMTDAVASDRPFVITSRSVYFPAFDYLRLVIALLVLSGHSGLIRGHDLDVDSVQIFFALSGWLIGGILLKTKVSDLPRFYYNRAARIWIPYIITVALLATASLMKDKVNALWFETFFFNLTFVYNLLITPQIDTLVKALPLEGTGNHVWSLCAEEQFYLLVPFLLMLPLFGRRTWFWCLISLVVWISPVRFYFGAVSLGMTAAAAAREFGNWQTTLASRAITGAIAIAGISAIKFDLAPSWFRRAAPGESTCG
jgi:peptidoglycan/LPS O-acetylase OafA/YrhL